MCIRRYTNDSRFSHKSPSLKFFQMFINSGILSKWWWEYYTQMKIMNNNEHGLQLQESICIKSTNTGENNLMKHTFSKARWEVKLSLKNLIFFLSELGREIMQRNVQDLVTENIMVNFLCPLAWAMRCPDFWLNVILGMSVKVFLDESNIWISRLNRVYCSP